MTVSRDAWWGGAAIAVALFAGLVVGTARAGTEGEQTPGAAALPPPANYPVPRREFDWQGEWRCLEVAFPSDRTGAQLFGVLFAPADLAEHGRLPAVVIGPGSGTGTQVHTHWSSRDLGGHGYIALTVDPQGVGRSETLGDERPLQGVPYQQAENYLDALDSALDFLLSTDNPWRHHVDGTRVGLAGHSQSARAASYLSGRDQRVKAVVAWDNLSSDLNGDAGAATGSHFFSSLIGLSLPFPPKPAYPVVPAMGQANDSRGSFAPLNGDPDLKKTAYSEWRAAGRPAMELVFRGAAHGNWAQLNETATEEDDARLREFQYYTRAWFDLFLKDDPTARHRLLADRVLGEPRSAMLSEDFHSAAYLPSVSVDCPALESECATDSLPPAPTVPDDDADSSGGGGGGCALGDGRGDPLLPLLALLAMLGLRRRDALHNR